MIIKYVPGIVDIAIIITIHESRREFAKKTTTIKKKKTKKFFDDFHREGKQRIDKKIWGSKAYSVTLYL